MDTPKVPPRSAVGQSQTCSTARKSGRWSASLKRRAGRGVPATPFGAWSGWRSPRASTRSRHGPRRSPSSGSTLRCGSRSASGARTFPPSTASTASRRNSAATPICSTPASLASSPGCTTCTRRWASTSPSTGPTCPPTRTVSGTCSTAGRSANATATPTLLGAPLGCFDALPRRVRLRLQARHGGLRRDGPAARVERPHRP